MSDPMSVVLAVLGAGGLTGFGTLVLRAFLQALKATAEINAEKNRTIDRLQGLVDRKNGELDRQDLEIDRLRDRIVALDLELGRARSALQRRQRGAGA